MSRIPAKARLLSEAEANEIMVSDHYELESIHKLGAFVTEYRIVNTGQKLYVDMNTRPPSYYILDPETKSVPVDQLPLI